MANINQSVSIIITTYNWPEALILCLRSINSQIILPGEIIIADDGSAEETKNAINSLIPEMKVPVVHCWQPDEGFRLSKVRNLALSKCRFEYIIQIDGDIICDKNFIKDHLEYKQPGYFISGKRINLGKTDTTETFINNRLYYSQESFVMNKFSHRYRNPLLMRAIKLSYINNLMNKGVLGSNMSYWHKDATLINGYNENITGWGKEDDEFAQRLIYSGIKKRGLRFGGIQYHLEHKKDLTNLAKNTAILEQTIKEKPLYKK